MDPIMDYLTLGNIFSSFPLGELKQLRLVCKTWNEEVLRHISKTKQTIHIHLHPKSIGSEEAIKAREAKRKEEAAKNAKDGKKAELTKLRSEEEKERRKQLKQFRFQDEVDEIADFLEHWKLTYELHIGILDADPKFKRPAERIGHPGPSTANLPPLRHPPLDQGNDSTFSNSMILNFLPKTSAYLKNFNLELILRDEQDYHLLERFIDCVEVVLPAMVIDFRVFPRPDLAKGWILKTAHDGSVLKKLDIQLPGGEFQYDTAREEMKPKYTFDVLKPLFPNAKLTSIGGPRMEIWDRAMLDEIIKILRRML